MRISAAQLFIVASVLAIGLPANAQTLPPRAVLDGVVTDSALGPLANAAASLVGTPLTVTTGPDGRFRIVGLPPRDYIVIVRRIGYAPVSAIVHPDAGDTLRASFMLAPVSAVLDTIVIAEPSIPRRLAEFERRRRAGQGQFMTQGQIEQHNFVGVSDLLRTFHSINIVNGIAVAQRAVMRLQPGPCALTFYLDGVRIPTPDVERDLPSPKDVAGIEVYANSGEIPLQYRSFGGDHPGWPSDGFCGVVLLWTRSGT